jgi:hypothetical protein
MSTTTKPPPAPPEKADGVLPFVPKQRPSKETYVTAREAELRISEKHHKEAVRYLAEATTWLGHIGDTYAAFAQVHATLAVAAAQRAVVS